METIGTTMLAFAISLSVAIFLYKGFVSKSKYGALRETENPYLGLFAFNILGSIFYTSTLNSIWVWNALVFNLGTILVTLLTLKSKKNYNLEGLGWSLVFFITLAFVVEYLFF